jgi:hypothetical protein
VINSYGPSLGRYQCQSHPKDDIVLFCGLLKRFL